LTELTLYYLLYETHKYAQNALAASRGGQGVLKGVYIWWQIVWECACDSKPLLKSSYEHSHSADVGINSNGVLRTRQGAQMQSRLTDCSYDFAGTNKIAFARI